MGSAAVNRVGEWVQVDLGRRMLVAGTVVQGRSGKHSQWVTRYNVEVSDNASYQMRFLQESAGSTDRNTERWAAFRFPVEARYVRFVVQSWKEHISMRVAVMVCE